MGVRLADLPKEVRDRVEQLHGDEKRRPRPSAAGTGGPQEVTCQQCRQVFDSFPKAERHGQGSGHMDQRITLR